jgi:hypothetical protein
VDKQKGQAGARDPRPVHVGADRSAIAVNEAQVNALANLIFDQFGAESGLAGISRQWAQHLSQLWLSRLQQDGP